VRGLRPFRHRDFTLFWAGFSVSQIGDWVEATTTAWLLYEITRSPVLLGVGGGVKAVSVVVFGLIGGAVADRVPRKRLVFLTQSGYALSSFVLGVLVVTGLVQFWHFYVLSAVTGALGAFDTPARRAMIPTLVPREDVQSALALNATVTRVGRIVGPAIAGVLIASGGPGASYFVNAASFGGLLVALVVMSYREAPPRARASLLRETLDGARYTLAHPLLRSLVILESVHSLFGLNTALLTILASDVLRIGPQGLGLLLAARAVGGLVGTGSLLALGDIRRKGQALLAAGTAYAAAFAVLPLATSTFVAAAVVATLGLMDTFWGTLRQTMFQLKSDDAYRGRTMGVLLLSGRGATQASQLETGLAVEAGGPGLAALLGAAAIGLSLIVVNLRTSDVRRFRGLPEVTPAIIAAESPEALGE
jgi:MFS family permease